MELAEERFERTVPLSARHIMSDKHYDGDTPNEPLPPEHFTRQQREDAKDLGDGSPALDPRGGREVEHTDDDSAADRRDE